MSKRFTALIIKEEKWFVAHCVELGVVSQGKTIEEAQANLKEAVELYVESFGAEELKELRRTLSENVIESVGRGPNKPQDVLAELSKRSKS